MYTITLATLIKKRKKSTQMKTEIRNDSDWRI